MAECQRDLAQALDIQVKEFESKRVQKDSSVLIGLKLTEEIYAQLIRCQVHASHKIQQERLPHTIESMIKVLTDYYIKGNKLNEPASNVEPAVKSNRTVTPKTRTEILNRDRCCQYKNEETGEICGETKFAQVDHIKPRWAGGNHAPENLQQMSANHNRRKYRKEAHLTGL